MDLPVSIIEVLLFLILCALLFIYNKESLTQIISDMDNFTQINDVYGSYFDDASAPARETVQVARLPKDVKVEISMIAVM